MGATSVKNIARPGRVHRIQLSQYPGATPLPVERAPSRTGQSVRLVLRRVSRVTWRTLRAVLLLVIALIVLYRWVMPPVTPLMLLRLPEAGKMEQRSATLDTMSADLSRALIAAYDHRFCRHKGVDWEADPETTSGGPGFLHNA